MEKNLRQYLLGALPKEEAEKIDLRLISDADFEQELMLAENELMEDFLDGELTPEENKRFRSGFLVSERRIKDLENLAVLRKYAAYKTSENESPDKIETRKISFWESISSYFSGNWRLAAAAFSVVIVALAFGFYLVGYEKNEIAELNREDLSDLDRYGNLSDISLVNGTFRAGGGVPTVSADTLTENVLIRLALPGDGGLFDVKILKNETEIAKISDLRSYTNKGGQELRLLLPAKTLTEGDYKIKITTENSSAPVTYNFSVN